MLSRENFVAVTVVGEVSNLARPASGHWYFSLKDEKAQLRAVMFKNRNRSVTELPKDGQQVFCTGSVSVYTARGEVQLVVDSLTAIGVGNLQVAFEELKSKLAAEGLFASENKHSLPVLPQVVGVVTSATGAAIHDIITVLSRRAPGIRVLLRPVRVQGDGAAEEISAAIADLNRHAEADVLIVGRGGGSLEDLWAFNEEIVARAISASKIPVISAVGHEVDFTIADFTADLRAATPSAAAEMVAKGRQELETHLDHLVMRLQSRFEQSLVLVNQRLEELENRLRLARRSWVVCEDLVKVLTHRLGVAIDGQLRRQIDRLGQSVGRLQALSPLDQLARGYVIASHHRNGAGLSRAAELENGQTLWLRFSDGHARARIDEVEP